MIGTKWYDATVLHRLGLFYLKAVNAANEFKKKRILKEYSWF